MASLASSCRLGRRRRFLTVEARSYVGLERIRRPVAAGDACAVVESVKAASDVYSPVTGEVIEANDALADSPELVNQDPYGDGWMIKIKLLNAADLEGLMDAAAYTAHVDG